MNDHFDANAGGGADGSWDYFGQHLHNWEHRLIFPMHSAGDQPPTGLELGGGESMLFRILKGNSLSSDLAVHHQATGGHASTDMATALDSLGFKPEGMRLPWAPKPAHHKIETGVFGTPDTDKRYWELQTTGFTCAVEAQRGIIQELTGKHISEAQLTYEATAHGWLSNHGMSPSDVGNLLELHGIACHSKTGSTVEDLMAELAKGHKVIVGVDSAELWHNGSQLHHFFRQAADHAIWVTAVNMTNPAHPQVIINDSGDPNGAGKAYDLKTFADAWHDSGFFYVSTNESPRDMSFAAGHGFDPESGAFTDLASYFCQFYADFQDRLRERLHSSDPITPSETPTLFTDAAVRAIIENLPKSPMASLNDSTTDTLFRFV